MKLLLVVGGGIAAYKAPSLVRACVKAGHEVRVVMTPAAQAFVTPMSLAVVSKHPVRLELLDTAAEGAVGHIELADWPDLVVVAPATANLMARAASGMANDLATTVLLATRAPVLYAPAMNTNMWRHAATVANLATLAGRGAHFVGPDEGDLACGWVGEGRMIDEAPILEAAEAAEAAVGRAGRDGSAWVGKRILVSAGPTRAYLDPVRFLTNASTGAMGFALAEAAARMGAAVTLVAGPVERPSPQGVRRVDVETAPQMLGALREELARGQVDMVAMVAAVSDLRAPASSVGKVEKAQLLRGMGSIAWEQEVDILATLVAEQADVRFLGFGAQTVDEQLDPSGVEAQLLRLGQAKLVQKGCDALFVNRVGVPGTGFGSATNGGHLLVRNGNETATFDSGPPIPKAQLASWILEQLGLSFWGIA